MIARLATLIWLLAVWLVMMGSFTPAAIVGGLAVSSLLMVVFQPARTPRDRLSIRPLGLLSYILFFSGKLVQANLQVARAVIRYGRDDLKRAIVEVPIVTASDTIVTLLANAISLTPGTFIVEMKRNPPTFYVHVLQITTVEEVQLYALDLERRLVEAIGPSDKLEEIERRMGALSKTINSQEDD